MRDRQRRRPHSWRSVTVAGVLLLCLFALLTLGSRQNSFTADEPAYIAGGYALLARGEEAFTFLSQRGYPPLLSGMEASLLYLAIPNVPLETLEGWPTAFDSFIDAFKPYMAPLQRTEVVTRMPVIFLTAVLAAVVFRWGKDLWGSKAGLLALVALVFDPTLLTHGRLATTDVGVVALGTASLYTAWRWSERPSWSGALGTGILLGLTMLAKVSGVLWTAAFVLIVVGTILRRRENRNVKLVAQGIAAGGLSLLVLWTGYGYTWGRVPGLPFAIPAPTYWESTRYLVEYTSEVFALGQRVEGRWWWYLPLAFLIKNPLPLLIGMTIGLFALWKKNPLGLRRSLLGSRFLALGLFPLLYTATAVLGGMNIGYRHAIPIHPFIYLAVGGGLTHWVWEPHGGFRRRLLLGVMGLWYVAGTLNIFAYEIAFFNELVGGPSGGYRYLADSNLDWGHSARTLEAYLQTHPDVNLGPPVARFRPAPGRYVIGASHLQGIGIGDPGTYAWFRHWEPQTNLKYSLLIYDVPPVEMTWIAQCERPAPPLNDVSIAQGMGREDIRTVAFDCTTGWLYPNGGKAPGIYALHHTLMEKRRLCYPSFLPCPIAADDPFINRHLATARLSYEQARDRRSPAFVLYEMTEPVDEPVPLAATYAAPVEMLPVDLTTVHSLIEPPVLTCPDEQCPQKGLAFLGAAAYVDGDELNVETWWRVAYAVHPISRPSSIMAHLLSSEGEALGTADGLGVWPLTWVPGDVVVQRHRFLRPPESESLWLRTGFYWRDTMELWSVVGVPEADALFVQIELD